MQERKLVKLLVIDDHADDCELIREYAEMFHPEYKVECRFADTGSGGLEVIRGWQPSVVVIDVHIADLNGFAVFESFSDHGAPVVATSRNRSDEIAQSAYDHGAVGYFPKSDNPDDFEILIELIASVAVPVTPLH